MEDTVTYDEQVHGHQLLSKLRDRIFDFSKSNRNIYFKAGRSFLALDLDQEVFHLEKGKVLVVDTEEDGLFTALNRIRIKANRNRRELGFNQLRLATVFVRWVNTKSDLEEVIESPLVLYPVELTKQRGLNERFEIKVIDNAELNPFLLRYWSDLFGFDQTPPKELSLENLRAWLRGIDPELQITLDGELEEVVGNRWQMVTREPKIGNFDFRRMSFIRDYDELVQSGFSGLDTTRDQPQDKVFEYQSAYNVLPSDPSQREAISTVAAGSSLLLQGPPGTGKSQTIVNAIANLVGAGKSVLLVSEKSVALDVVRERFRQVGLDDLILYAHDSKSDRKRFISELSDVYYKTLESTRDQERIVYERKKIVHDLTSRYQGVQRYFDQLGEEDADGISLNHLLEEGLQAYSEAPDLVASDRYLLPKYSVYREVENAVSRLADGLTQLGYTRVFSKHPISSLKPSVLAMEGVQKNVHAALEGMADLQSMVLKLRELGWDQLELSELRLLFIRNGFIQKLVDLDLRYLLDVADTKTKKYDRIMRKLLAARKRLDKLQEKNQHWITPLASEDVLRAIEVLNRTESGLRRWSLSRRRVVKVVSNNYSFSAHAVKPTTLEVLTALKKQHESETEEHELREQLHELFGIDSPELVHAVVRDVRDKLSNVEDDELVKVLVAGDSMVKEVAVLSSRFDGIYYELKKLMGDVGHRTLGELSQMRDALLGCVDELPIFQHHVKPLLNTASVYEALRKLPTTDEELKAAVIDKEVKDRLNLRYWLKQTNAEDIRVMLQEIKEAEIGWQAHNVEWIASRVESRLHYAQTLSLTPAVKLGPEEKQEKKKIVSAKRILEREFAKTRRYKSLRELVDEGANELIRLIKPVWMMSPHSVSENMSLTQEFDVVIFDEASQVRLEEGLPALLRASQAVVVGDEMQLPPGNFFRKGGTEDELPTSLLEYIGSSYKRKRLSWHYRSESQKLIELSNRRFYAGELVAVPAVDPVPQPVEVHHLQDGQFIDRKNTKEARKVTQLVKQVLMSGEKSLGVVAFSADQASAIEDALEQLSNADPIFSEMLDQAYDFENNGQYEGLFVKNLENVQGDERNVMIVSTGYGPNAEGKFIQQMGPVSQGGGERRLNVLFTRARKKIHVVTSMVSGDITSQQDGPVFLKGYLERHAQDGRTAARKSGHESVQGLSNGWLTQGGSYLTKLDGTAENLAAVSVFAEKGWKVACYDPKTQYTEPKLVQNILK